jgi:hypothetical protein
MATKQPAYYRDLLEEIAASSPINYVALIAELTEVQDGSFYFYATFKHDVEYSFCSLRGVGIDIPANADRSDDLYLKVEWIDAWEVDDSGGRNCDEAEHMFSDGQFDTDVSDILSKMGFSSNAVKDFTPMGLDTRDASYFVFRVGNVLKNEVFSTIDFKAAKEREEAEKAHDELDRKRMRDL